MAASHPPNGWGKSILVQSTLMERQPEPVPTTGGRRREPKGPIRAMVDLKHMGRCSSGQMPAYRLPFEKVQRAFEMYKNQEDGIIMVVMTV